MTIDITKNELLISHFQHVLRSSMTPKKITHTHRRQWDAFCYILNGRCRYTFSDRTEFVATKGCVIYLAKDALYDMDVEEGKYESIFSDFLFDSHLPRQSAVFHPKAPDETEHRFLRLYQRFSVKSAGYRSDCLSLLYRVLGTLQAISTPQYLPSSSRHQLELARSFILEHFADESLSVKDLAQRADLSEVYFRKLFQATYGSSPIAYIIDARLANAKELMRYSDLSLEEIALQSGFSSLSYFCRVFKQQTDLTPGQYRHRWSQKLT